MAVGAPARVARRPTPRAVAGLLLIAALVACLTRPDAGIYAIDAIGIVASLAAAGFALFAAVFETAPREVVALAVTGFATALVAVALDIGVVAGRGISGLADATAREVVLRGGDYQAALARAAGLCLVAWAFRSAQRSQRTALLTGALITCGSFGLSGHVRTHSPLVLVLVCVCAHVVAAAAWLGGVIGLAYVLRNDRLDRLGRARVLATFSGLMTGVVAMLLAGGVGLAFLYLPSVHALVATAYGQVLIVKVGLVAGLLLLSASNHVRLVPGVVRGDPAAFAALRMNVAVEQLVLVVIVIVTTILVRQSPVP
jgi:copper transport protein